MILLIVIMIKKVDSLVNPKELFPWRIRHQRKKSIGLIFELKGLCGADAL